MSRGRRVTPTNLSPEPQRLQLTLGGCLLTQGKCLGAEHCAEGYDAAPQHADSTLGPNCAGWRQRTLRGGKAFSPYEIKTGPPVEVHPDFDLAQCFLRLDAREKLGEEDSDVETEPLLPADDSPSVLEDAPLHGKRKRSPTPTTSLPQRLRAASQGDSTLKAKSRKNTAASAAHAIETDLDLQDDKPPSGPAWIGKRGAEWVEEGSYHPEPLADLLARLKYIRWNGVDCRPIVDRARRIIALLGGTPSDPNWDQVNAGATAAIECEAVTMSFKQNQTHPRRGPHKSAAKGLSHGGGQTEPGMLKNPAATNLALSIIFATVFFSRLAGFANCLFECYAPKIFAGYRDQKTNFLRHNRGRRFAWNFVNSVFACATLNFGPATVCLPHIDFANLAWGWCAITALGRFDPDKGGHLILWDLGLIIRFPPGSTVLIPSALLWHSNVNIQPGETRYSFTQYSAGGLFRWEANGFQTDEAFEATAMAEDMELRAAAKETRWRDGMELYSHLDDLN
ncbi:hypothetical protein C8J57DRAFT_1247470 [Mycena rebaudengoi]|nr:hypothetical protein C8J57DRAFT_1247470 [Mycena rebaudengoi]